jgi:DNA sulfur modification protein DndD
MKLIKILIKNFRQFYGEQEIVFSTDSEKNVTLIHGENNGGKTALLNAIRWCLYQNFSPNFQEQQSLVNETAKREGIGKFSVSITLEYNGEEYLIQRFSSNGSIDGKLAVAIITDGAQTIKDSGQFLINSIIPQNMADFFFYQGEGDGGLTNTNNFEYIRKSIKTILGFDIAERTLLDLSNIKSGYTKNLSMCDVSGSLDTLYDQQMTYENNIKTSQQALAFLETEINKYQTKYDEVDQQIKNSNIEVINEQVKARTKAEVHFNNTESDINSVLLNKTGRTSTWAKDTFSNRLAKFNLGNIDTSELNLAHKFSVDKVLIRQLIEESECICGSELVHDSTQQKTIEKLLSSAVDSELKSRWKRVETLKKQITGRSDKAYADMAKTMKQYEMFLDRKGLLSGEIKELSAKISSVKHSDISSLEKTRTELSSLLISKRTQKVREEPQIEQYQNQLKSINHQIKTQEGALPQGERFKKLIRATESIIKLIENALNEAEQGSDNIVLAKMQQFFKRVSFSGLTVKKSKNQWRIVNADGKAEGVGGGYQTMLSISFVVSLIQYSSDRANSQNYLLTPGTVAPFIADAILSEVSPDNGKALLGYISECVEQAVFMLSQMQWTENKTDQEIRTRIGKEYNFIECTTMSEDDWSGDYPTKLSVAGKDYDVVRFNSNFKGSIIEEITHV